MKDSIIIVSGGMDSITMLYEYKDRIALGVWFDYGRNPERREIPFAEVQCMRLG
uniref:7-cyano-7-deazaguanine synthase n=1 Tax=Prevotella sp. TaxID=59823 RepID=UPI003FEE3878